MNNQNQKGISSLLLIVIIVGILAIGGVLAYQYYWQASEEEIEEETSTDETADWKVYRNEEIGYEVKYPKDWYVKEEYRSECKFEDCLEYLYIENIEEKVIVAGEGPFTENGSYFKIVILKAENISSIEEWIEKGDIPDRVKQERLDFIITLEIGGIEIKAWKGTGSADGGIEFIKDGRFYRIHYISGSQEQFDKDLDIFKQMLSTFRFIEKEETKEEGKEAESETQKEVEPVSLTEVIRYIPTEAPDEVYEGSCWTNASSTIRKDAWRCMVGNFIKDPCFVFESNKSLVCEAYPPTGDKGVLLKLTELLPEPNVSEDKFGEGWAWLIELEDGTVCGVITGTTVIVNGKRMNFSCGEIETAISGILGDLQVGKVWKAEKAILEKVEEKWQAKTVELVPIRRVWQ